MTVGQVWLMATAGQDPAHFPTQERFTGHMLAFFLAHPELLPAQPPSQNE